VKTILDLGPFVNSTVSRSQIRAAFGFAILLIGGMANSDEDATRSGVALMLQADAGATRSSHALGRRYE
jgi:hypothetical protein